MDNATHYIPAKKTDARTRLLKVARNMIRVHGFAATSVDHLKRYIKLLFHEALRTRGENHDG